MNTDGMKLRVAVERDVPHLAALWTQVFPGGRAPEERIRELRDGMPYGSLADCRVLEVEGRMAAALRAYPMALHFQGRLHPTLGLAGVAVAPDFRRRGLGKRICMDALREGRRRGQTLSLLYPFRASFYAGMGYALAGELHHHRFRLRELPLFPGWERVAGAEHHDLAEVQALYARVAAASNGLLEREPSVWRVWQRPAAHPYLYRSAAGNLTGYALVQSEGGRRRPTLRVRELMWEDEEAYRALLGWISAQRDQHVYATHDALPSEGFHRLLPHPRVEGSGFPRGLWWESARILRGPMLRLLDVGALQEEGGDEAVWIHDEDVPENAGRWRGGQRVQEAADVAAAPGGLTVADAARAFLAGALPGQAPPPDGWAPVSGIHDFRLLDEF